MEPQIIDWLLAGDPSIRWQVLRDLLDAPSVEVELERAEVARIGWGAQLLSHQDADGLWAKGIYSPKWRSTTYTLLLLRQLGLPAGNDQARRGCEKFFFRGLEKDGGINWFKSFGHSETCVNGMILTLLSYFRFPDERLHSVADYLLREQMPDGGWNCQWVKGKGASHASFHTTISVLEGLAEYALAFPPLAASLQPARQAAHEFLLRHHLYQSHRTGSPADPAMTLMHFPPRWHYDFLRGLDYFQSVHAARDERIQPAIALLLEKQTVSGQWLLNRPWPGLVFFTLEETGQPSRWNTLRALRVLKWWQSG